MGYSQEPPGFCSHTPGLGYLLEISPIWAIFQLQDFLGIDEVVRRKDPNEERINVPANPKHYWRYRMHLNLEDLIQEDTFNKEWNDAIQTSGR